MCRFKSLLLLLLILLSAFNINVSKPYLTKWVIIKGSFLKVGGSTNINKFSCEIANYSRPDTITFYKGNFSETLKLSGSMELNVQNFDCHNPVMTSDLRKTLKVKEFPKLTISFVSISRYPDYKKNTEAVKGIVTIELAGVTKRFNIDYKLIQNRSDYLTLVGTRQVNFSDFNIIPPRRMGGMIQTNNELNVEFNLNVKVLE